MRSDQTKDDESQTESPEISTQEPSTHSPDPPTERNVSIPKDSEITEKRFGTTILRPTPSTLLSWRYEFSGPDIAVSNADGEMRDANEDDFAKRPAGASDTGQSDTVVSVHDMGFCASQLQLYGSDCPLWNQDKLSEDPMSIEKLRQFLDLEPKDGVGAAESIREKVDACITRNEPDKQQYLSIGHFEYIFQIGPVKSLLKEKHPDANAMELQSKMAQIVGDGLQTSRRRILAILVRMSCVEYIEQFIQHDIVDDDLPLIRCENNQRHFMTRNKRSVNQNAKIMQHWETHKVDLFYHYQPYLFVPFFDFCEGRLSSYDLGRNITLPWQECQPLSRGGNAMVHVIRIHPSHHNFKRQDESNKPTQFALKEIDSPDYHKYSEELRALEKNCAKMQKEKHLVDLLLTFKHGNKFYLIFELADSNLQQLWDKKNLGHSPSVARWLVEQCLGIAGAIKRIHGFATWQKTQRDSASTPTGAPAAIWGRHGDIKPTNILWFSGPENSYGTLVVCDLGLTRYHTLGTRSAVPYHRLDGCTQAYSPPEIDTRGPISQKYDIWSLGCVFLEFCIWYLEGPEALWKFEYDLSLSSKRIDGIEQVIYYTIKRSDEREYAQVNPIVLEWIKRLRNTYKRTIFAGQMLDLIEERMLVVDQAKRQRIDGVCAEITQILHELPRGYGDTISAPEAELMKEEDHINLGDDDDSDPKNSSLEYLIQHTEGNSSPTSPDGERPPPNSLNDDLEGGGSMVGSEAAPQPDSNKVIEAITNQPSSASVPSQEKPKITGAQQVKSRIELNGQNSISENDTISQHGTNVKAIAKLKLLKIRIRHVLNPLRLLVRSIRSKIRRPT